MERLKKQALSERADNLLQKGKRNDPNPSKTNTGIREKTGVTDQDSILILDAVSGEGRLADKEELRGPRGFQGLKGDTGAKGVPLLSISLLHSKKQN